MKRISALIVTLAVILAGMTTLAPAASAKKVDRRPCVSRAEFRQVYQTMPASQVHSIFDTIGYELKRYDTYFDDGYWDSYYVSDGYWDYADYDGDGITDETTWIDTSYWVDDWVDTGYWMTDVFKSYKKCRSFNHGRGRVAINFDNYSSPGPGMRLFSKYRNNPWTIWARTVQTNKIKSAEKTPQNTPAPHRNLKRTVIKTG